MEAPKEIFIEQDARTGLFYSYFVNRLDSEKETLNAVSYVRKDIYDKAQSRIKELEEERRLLYVAITRAEEKLYITFARRRRRW